MQEKRRAGVTEGQQVKEEEAFWRMIHGEIISEQKHVRIGTSHGT